METAEIAAYILHSVFAGLWTGAVLFVAYVILPLARDGQFNAKPLHTVTGKIKRVSRVSALVLFVTGSFMAPARYTSETLTGTTGGYLVLSMLGLWFFLIAAVEVGASKLAGGTGRDKVREPARNARPFFLAASILALLLLVNAGLLSARNVGFL